MAEVWRDYVRGRTIGRGRSATAVLLHRPSDGHQVVVKEVGLDGLSPKERAECENEVAVLRMLAHPNILTCLDSFTPAPALGGMATFNIVTEFCAGGTLDARLRAARKAGRPLDERQIYAWLLQLADALAHMHSRRVLHRDVKAANIFLSAPLGPTGVQLVKLGDLGVARVLSADALMAETMIGTPYYLSPELVQGMPYGAQADVWALGIVLYEMVALRRPFVGEHLSMLAWRVCQADFPPPELDALPPDWDWEAAAETRAAAAPPPRAPAGRYSAELYALIGAFLQKEPSERIELDALLASPIAVRELRAMLGLGAHAPLRALAELAARGESAQRRQSAARRAAAAARARARSQRPSTAPSDAGSAEWRDAEEGADTDADADADADAAADAAVDAADEYDDDDDDRTPDLRAGASLATHSPSADAPLLGASARPPSSSSSSSSPFAFVRQRVGRLLSLSSSELSLAPTVTRRHSSWAATATTTTTPAASPLEPPAAAGARRRGGGERASQPPRPRARTGSHALGEAEAAEQDTMVARHGALVEALLERARDAAPAAAAADALRDAVGGLLDARCRVEGEHDAGLSGAAHALELLGWVGEALSAAAELSAELPTLGASGCETLSLLRARLPEPQPALERSTTLSREQLRELLGCLVLPPDQEALKARAVPCAAEAEPRAPRGRADDDADDGARDGRDGDDGDGRGGGGARGEALELGVRVHWEEGRIVRIVLLVADAPHADALPARLGRDMSTIIVSTCDADGSHADGGHADGGQAADGAAARADAPSVGRRGSGTTTPRWLGRWLRAITAPAPASPRLALLDDGATLVRPPTPPTPPAAAPLPGRRATVLLEPPSHAARVAAASETHAAPPPPPPRRMASLGATPQPPPPHPPHPHPHPAARLALAPMRRPHVFPAPVLSVRVVRCARLNNIHVGGLIRQQINPYVTLRVGGVKRRTPAVAASTSPSWEGRADCAFQWELPTRQAEAAAAAASGRPAGAGSSAQHLEIAIKDKNAFGRNEWLARHRLPIALVPPSTGASGTFLRLTLALPSRRVRGSDAVDVAYGTELLLELQLQDMAAWWEAEERGLNRDETSVRLLAHDARALEHELATPPPPAESPPTPAAATSHERAHPAGGSSALALAARALFGPPGGGGSKAHLLAASAPSPRAHGGKELAAAARASGGGGGGGALVQPEGARQPPAMYRI